MTNDEVPHGDHGDGQPCDDATGGLLDLDAEIVALRLAEGCSDGEAALAIGRGAKWVQRRRRADPRFVERVRELKAARVAAAAAGLGALLEPALGAVARGLSAERTADQLAAARLVFDRSRSFRADVEMAAEVDELRAEIAALRSQLRSLGIEEAS